MSLLYNGTPISKVSYNGSDLSSLTYNGNELIEDIDYNYSYLFAQKAEDTPEGIEIGYPASTTGVNGAYRWNGFIASGTTTSTGSYGTGHEVYNAFNRTATAWRCNSTDAFAQLIFPFEVEFKKLSIGKSGVTDGQYLVNKSTVQLGYTSNSNYSTFSLTGYGDLTFPSGIRGNVIKVMPTGTKSNTSTGVGGYMAIRFLVVHFFARRSDIVNWQNQYGLTFKQREVS